MASEKARELADVIGEMEEYALAIDAAVAPLLDALGSARKLNRYTCRSGCGFSLISEDKDEGVTPFMMPCKCGGDACSHFYTLSEDDNAHVLPADIEWYKPEKAEVRRMSRAMREHVKNGGLQFRPVSPRAEYLKRLLARGEA